MVKFSIYLNRRVFVMLPSFELIGLSVQQKKFKTDLQDGGQGGYLEFPFGMILAVFYLQVPLTQATKF